MSLLAVVGVSIARGGRRVVEELSFTVGAGTVTALMGPSGTGKTTILRAIARLDPVELGRIETEGRVGMVFQFHHLFAHMSAHQNVWLAPVHVLGEARGTAERRARDLLETLGIGHRADAFPHELSGGEAQRVAIARALAIEPALLLMDEPTASLDPARRGELAATVRHLATRGRAVVIATHDADFADACADRVLVLEGGRVVHERASGKVS
jgi:ABC-type polar amino acid transport system ATPase subunit